MKSIDRRWSIWINSSINTHLQSQAAPYHIYFEGAERETRNQSDWFEVEINGPHYKSIQGGWKVAVDVLVICASTQQVFDLYRCQRMMAQMEEALSHFTHISQCGHDGDTGGQFICINLDTRGIRSSYNGVQTSSDAHRGLVKEIYAHRGTVTASYEGFISYGGTS